MTTTTSKQTKRALGALLRDDFKNGKGKWDEEKLERAKAHMGRGKRVKRGRGGRKKVYRVYLKDFPYL